MNTPTPSAPTALGAAPAKLILFGEHSVIYGQPALGMALSRGVKVRLRPGTGQVQLQCASQAPKGAATPRALFRAALGPRADELDATVIIEVPPSAGLGTSAALAVALLRARGSSDDEQMDRIAMLAAAIEVENVAHGTSSGLDPAICIDGGVVRFTRRDGKPRAKRVRLSSSFHLVVGVHGTHGGTAARVQDIATLRRRAEVTVEAAMTTLGCASNAGGRALIEGDLGLAGQIMNLAHGLLGGLGLVGDTIEVLVRLAREHGALGAKMSGAGGHGGAFFALVPDIQTGHHIVEAWTERGAEAWVETAS